MVALKLLQLQYHLKKNSLAYRQVTLKREGAQSVYQSMSHKIPQKPPTPVQKPIIGRKTHKKGLKHALRRIVDHCDWSEYQKKKSVSEMPPFELPRVENCISMLCPNALEAASPPPPLQTP